MSRSRPPLPIRGSRSPLGCVLLGIPDPAEAGVFAQALEEAGLLPILAFSSKRILLLIDTLSFDIVLLNLELALPRAEPFLRAIGARTDAALLTLNGIEDGRLSTETLIACGVHESIPRFSSPSEVAAQATALLGLRGVSRNPRVLTHGPLELNLGTRQAFWFSDLIQLTPIQFRMLAIFCFAQGDLVTCQDLSRLLWDSGFTGDSERIVSHIRRIRRKIELDPSHPEFLVTVRGEGYRFVGAALPPNARPARR